MEKILKLVAIISAFVVVFCAAYVLYVKLAPQFAQDPLATVSTQATTAGTGSTEEHDHDHDHEHDHVHNQAPEFLVYDAQGNEVHLSDYYGKPIVLNFWASWCGPCQMEMPDFNEKFLEVGDEVQFLMVNVTDGDRETMETASAFIAEKGYSFPVLFDLYLDASAAYNATALPMTVLINREGNIVAYATGAITAETLQQGIDIIS